jgi:hypothetical protein
MVHRVALFLASLTAALVLAAGLAIGGLAPAADPAPLTADVAPAATDAAPAPTVKVDTVYVTPKVKPKHITVTRTVPSRSGAGENEHEGGGD